MAYSTDFRVLAIRKYHVKRSFRRAARCVGISSSTLHAWVEEGVNLGAAKARAARRKKRRRAARIPLDVQHFLAATAIEQRVTSLYRLRGLVQAAAQSLRFEAGSVSCKTISRVLRQQGVSRKRTSRRMCNRGAVTAEVVRTFCEGLREAERSSPLVVSIDECYFSERVLPLYGYSKVGRKCVVAAPQGSWKKVSLLLAIASDGSQHYEMFDGSVAGKTFAGFVTGLPFPSGSTLIMDNVAFHKNTSAADAMGFRVLFTPPYSPQFNPVEMAFSKAKAAFRAAWPWLSGVDSAIDDAVASITTGDAVSFFSHLAEEIQKVSHT
jgi:DNA-binding Lrp family transcriptional regulator